MSGTLRKNKNKAEDGKNGRRWDSWDNSNLGKIRARRATPRTQRRHDTTRKGFQIVLVAFLTVCWIQIAQSQQTHATPKSEGKQAVTQDKGEPSSITGQKSKVIVTVVKPVTAITPRTTVPREAVTAPCIYGDLIASNFPASQWSIACRVMIAESGGRPTAINHNGNGSIDMGLFQVNSIHKFTGNLFDPSYNVQMARIVWNYQGWDAWSVCKSKVRCK